MYAKQKEQEELKKLREQVCIIHSWFISRHCMAINVFRYTKMAKMQERVVSAVVPSLTYPSWSWF